MPLCCVSKKPYLRFAGAAESILMSSASTWTRLPFVILPWSARFFKFPANFKNRADQGRITKGRRVHVEALDIKIDSAAPANLRYGFFDTQQSGIAGARLSVTQINLQAGAARDTVDSARLDAKNTRCSNCVATAAVQGGLFHRERDFGAGEQCIVPFGH